MTSELLMAAFGWRVCRSKCAPVSAVPARWS